MPSAISVISPASGVAGTTVTITGANFSTTPADNTVKFNGVATNVTSATATTLVVNGNVEHIHSRYCNRPGNRLLGKRGF